MWFSNRVYVQYVNAKYVYKFIQMRSVCELISVISVVSHTCMHQCPFILPFLQWQGNQPNADLRTKHKHIAQHTKIFLSHSIQMHFTNIINHIKRMITFTFFFLFCLFSDIKYFSAIFDHKTSEHDWWTWSLRSWCDADANNSKTRIKMHKFVTTTTTTQLQIIKNNNAIETKCQRTAKPKTMRMTRLSK